MTWPELVAETLERREHDAVCGLDIVSGPPRVEDDGTVTEDRICAACGRLVGVRSWTRQAWEARR